MTFHPNVPVPPPTRPRRRGAALMIVMVVIAVATVLGFAMVSASSLQSQTAGNLKYASTAEYLAESGAQLALYYLQNPTLSPVARPNGYYPGQAGVTFGAAVKGSADVTVTYDAAAKQYTITSVGRASTNNEGVNISKTVTATAGLVTKYTQTTAMTVANNLTLYGSTSVTGNIDTNGTFAIPALTGAMARGTVRYRTTATTPIGTFTGTKVPLSAGETVSVPSLATIRDYTGTYTYQGQTYTAKKLTAASYSSTTMPSAADAVTNPAGVYWTDQAITTFGGGVNFNGTLVITNGKLVLSGLGNTFTPKVGFPAAVVSGNVEVSTGTTSATFNGLVWTGGFLKTGTVGSNVTINGAYLSAGSTPIDPLYKGFLTITYDAAKVAVPDFSTTNATTIGVRVASWALN
jgi:Tfp pilus assembly protein PilX